MRFMHKKNNTIIDLKLLREELLMSQRELAEYLGVSQTTIQNWEKDIYKPSLKYQKLLNRLFNEINK